MPSLPHLPASQRVEENAGGSPDFSAFIDHSIGTELAASVLASEEPRSSSGAFPPSLPVPRPGGRLEGAIRAVSLPLQASIGMLCRLAYSFQTAKCIVSSSCTTPSTSGGLGAGYGQLW